MYFDHGRPLRSDAHRNRQAIIEAALATFTGKPGARVGEIAAVAGVSRGTLYSHFPSRHALIAAAFRWVMTEIDEQLDRMDPMLPARESLEELVTTSWWVLGHLAGMTAVAMAELPASELRRLPGESLLRIHGLLTRGRDEGVFRTDQDPTWQAACLYAILQAGASRIRDRHVLQPDVAAEMVATILAMLAAVPGGSEGGPSALPAR